MSHRRVYVLGFDPKNWNPVSCRPSPEGEAFPPALIEEGRVYGIYNYRGELTAVLNDRNNEADLPETIAIVDD